MKNMTDDSGFLNPTSPIPGLESLTVSDFWQWAYSDILSNRNRSIFAEFIVGSALGVVDSPRVEWDSADLCYRNYRIEVKSSADCQSWYQEKLSTIRFSIGKAVVWTPATGKYEGEPTRCADAYVFCHYPERDKTKVNVLHVPAWDFYVISTAALNREFGDAKSLSLASVRRVGQRCKFDELKPAVDVVFTATAAKGTMSLSGEVSHLVHSLAQSPNEEMRRLGGLLQRNVSRQNQRSRQKTKL